MALTVCVVLILVASIGVVTWLLPNGSEYFHAPGLRGTPRTDVSETTLPNSRANHPRNDHDLLVGTETPRLASEANRAKGLTEVCGLGKVAMNEFGAPDMRLDDVVINARLADLASDLTDSGDAQVRATGIYMQAWAAGRIAMDEAGKDPSCASLPDGGCYDKSRTIGVAKSIEVAAPLIEMAKKTTDPSIYHAALQLCNAAFSSRPPACADISAKRLTAIDPRNAQSWLYLAAEADRRKDPAAEEAALQRATEQSEYIQRRLPLHVVLESERLSHEAPLVKVYIANSVLTYEAINGTAGMPGVLQRFCKQPGLDLPGRMDACRNLGKTMDAGAVGILGEKLAEVFYERTGASKEEIRLRRGEYHALMGFLESQADEGYGCDAITRMADLVYSSLKFGERRAIRERLKEKGETMANLIAKREAAYRAAGKDPYPPR